MLQELTLFLSQDDCSSYWQIFLLLILGLVVGVTPGTLISPYQEIMPRVSNILRGMTPGSGFATDLDPCLILTIKSLPILYTWFVVVWMLPRCMYKLCKHSIKAHACPAPERKIFVFHMTTATFLHQNSSYISCVLWLKLNILKVIKRRVSWP